jgi:hypothetical protein
MIALMAVVAGCTAPQGKTTGPGMTAFNGKYEGTGVSTCDQNAHSISINVRGDQIWMHPHHKMTGTVSEGGDIYMQNASGSHRLTGNIQNGILTATDVATEGPKKLKGFYTNAASTCTMTIQANRVGGTINLTD